ncbi:MAG: hypothetical protein KBD46_00385 [Candidatus Levybacteria bacterium]|nr:hypothetical protein [Candidatus Levybacteria bacterium]
MKCPKCERGIVRKVTLKDKGQVAFLCNFCEMLWLEGEEIKENTGHPLDILTQGNAIEYTLEPTIENDPDDGIITNPHGK